MLTHHDLPTDMDILTQHSRLFDAKGQELLPADWVRVLALPASFTQLPHQSQEVFHALIGNTYQIQYFQYNELVLEPPKTDDTVWLEPNCVQRSRRYQHFSQKYKRSLLCFTRAQLRFVLHLAPEEDEKVFMQRLVTTQESFDVFRISRRVVKGCIYLKQDAIPQQKIRFYEHAIAQSLHRQDYYLAFFSGDE